MRLRAPNTPSGKPIASEMTTATRISAIVSIAFGQRSMNPM